MRQQLFCGQIVRLTAVEDGLGDVRGEIAEADEPCEIGWLTPSRLASATDGTPWLSRSVVLNWRALISSLTSRASGFAMANGLVPSINILIARPERRNRTGMDKI